MSILAGEALRQVGVLRDEVALLRRVLEAMTVNWLEGDTCRFCDSKGELRWPYLAHQANCPVELLKEKT